MRPKAQPMTTMENVLNELLIIIEENSIDNKCTIENVHYFVSQWRSQMKFVKNDNKIGVIDSSGIGMHNASILTNEILAQDRVVFVMDYKDTPPIPDLVPLIETVLIKQIPIFEDNLFKKPLTRAERRKKERLENKRK